MKKFVIPAAVLACTWACGTDTPTDSGSETAGPTAEKPGTMLAYNDVKPIFDANCVGCHGAKKASEKLRLDSYAAVLKGSEHGAMVVAGDSGGSKLVKRITGDVEPRMPFKKEPLSKEDIDKITQWIAQGAKEYSTAQQR
ncbi:MAG: c-type cytochrome [Armatimonadetes bacterium]|nr:c-type cytochrome [Armatimonadota bacterium]